MKPNYFLSVADFSIMFNLSTGKPYRESRNKDMKLLKDLDGRGVLEDYQDFRQLFSIYFDWYSQSWHKEQGIPPSIGILVKNIQKVVAFKKPSNSNKGLFL